MNTSKESGSKELDQVYRGQAIVLTARAMVVLHRQRSAQDECLPLAIRLLSQLIREQPGNSAAILSEHVTPRRKHRCPFMALCHMKPSLVG